MKSYFLSDGEVKQTTNEVFTKQRKPKYLRIKALRPSHIYQADLFFYQDKIMLSCVDVYSRQGYMQKCSTKSAENVLKAFKIVLGKFGKKCEVLMIDKGKEFFADFKKYCRLEKIELRLAKSDGDKDKGIHYAQAIVERLNRTFRSLIKSYLEEEDKINFSQKDLDILNENYNRRKHSAFKPPLRPKDVFSGKVVPEYREYKQNVFKIGLKDGDRVRVLLQRPEMSKNSKNKRDYSKRVYEIISRKKNRFILNDEKEYPYTRLRLSGEEKSTEGDALKKLETMLLREKKREKEREKKDNMIKLSRRLGGVYQRRSSRLNLRNKIVRT